MDVSRLKPFLFFIVTLLAAAKLFAAPVRTTYQAKIIKPDGYPLEAASVNFRFTILDPSASCVLYVEDYAAVNMGDSAGLISFSLGNGVRSFPTSGTASTFATVFDNSVTSFSCQTPGIYSPVSSDNRKIVMQFQDSLGWQTLPAMAINAVPYAMYAGKSDNAIQLNGKADSAFVEYSTLAGLSCAADQAIKFNGVSFSCITVGSGGGGGITSVTTSGTVLTTGGTASAPVISITAASMSADGYLTSLDYAEFKAKLSASSTQIVNTLGYAPVSGAAVATQISSSNLSGDVSGTISSNSVVSVGGKSAAQISTSVDATLSATANASASTIVKRDASGNFTANDVYASSTKINYVDIYKPSTNFNIRLQAPTSLAADYVLTLPTSSGTVGQVLSTDGAGNLSWTNPTTGSVISVSATAPLSSTGGSTPTISITRATSSTDGYLAGSDFTTFSQKLDRTGNLSDLTNIATARANLGLGDFATASSVDLGSASATGTLAIARLPNFIGDATIQAASNTIIFSNSGVTSGTYTKVSVNAKGIVTSGAQLTNSDVVSALGYTPANSATIISSQWTTSGTTINYMSGNVGVGTVNPSSLVDIDGGSTASTKLTLQSSATTGPSVVIKSNDTGGHAYELLSTGTANSPTAGYFRIHDATSAATRIAIDPNGNVGIGTTAPTVKLEVVGTIKATAFEGQLTSSNTGTSGNYTINTDSDNTGSDGGVNIQTNGATVARFTAAGVLQAASGTAAAPGISFLNDTNTGISNPAADVLSLSTNGISRIYVDPNGNVGVGTNSPQDYGASYKNLEVKGGTANTGGIFQSSTSDSSVKNRMFVDSGLGYFGTSTNHGIGFQTSGTERIRVDSAGNVGIGTTAPIDKLQVADATEPNSSLLFTGPSTAGNKGALIFQHLRASDSAVERLGYIQGIAENNQSNGGMRFVTRANGDIETMRLTAAGNIGIGTTTPRAQLDVSGSVTIGNLAANNAALTIYTQDSGSVSHGIVLIDRDAGYGSWQNPSGLDGIDANSSGTVTGWGQLYFNFYSTGDINFNNGGGDSRFNGRVGIGTTPTAKLHIAAGTSSTAALKFVSGTLLTTPQTGAVEYNGFNFYITDGTGTRRAIATTSSSGTMDNVNNINASTNMTLTPVGSVVVSATTASTNSNTGALVVKGGLGVAGNINTAGNLNVSGSSVIDGSLKLSSMTSGSVLFAGANGTVTQDNSSFYWDGANKRLGIGSNSPAQTLSVSGTSYFSGNVGIGTVTPAYNLDIDVKTADMRIKNSGTAGYPVQFMDSYSDFATWAGSALIMRRARGTEASPTYVNSGDSLGYMAFRDHLGGGGALIGTIATEAHSATAKGTALIFQTNANTVVAATEKMRIDHNGNVGIGTSTPSNKLAVVGGSDAFSTDIYGLSTGNFLRLGTQSGGVPSIDARNNANSANVNMTLQVNGGNVGIGTTSPIARLEVEMPASASSRRELARFTHNSNNTFTISEFGSTHGVVPSTVQLSAWNSEQNIAIVTDSQANTEAGGSTKGIYIKSGGNVGIGITAPTSKLSIYSGNDGSMDSIQIHGGSLSASRYGILNVHDTSEYIRLGYYNGTAMKNIFLDGSIGIGTTSPNYSLDVVGASLLRGGGAHTVSAPAYGGTYFSFDGPTNVAGLWAVNNTTSNFAFYTKTGNTDPGTERMRIDSNGNVGIGTTTPNAQLHVNGNIKANQITDNTSGNAFYINTASVTAGLGSVYMLDSEANPIFEAAPIGSRTNYSWLRLDGGTDTQMPHIGSFASATNPGLSLGPNAANSLVIDASGRVGIGTTAPAANVKFQVETPESSWGINLARSGTLIGGIHSNGGVLTVGAASGAQMSFPTTGNVGISNTSPSYKLDVAGDVNATGCVRASGSTLGGTCTSDERLKTEVQSFDLGLDALLGINPKLFKYNGLGGQPASKNLELGVIAQDVEKTAPELIVTKEVKLHATDEKTTVIKQVNYTAFTYVIINAVKELYNKFMGHDQQLATQARQIASKADKEETEALKAEVKAKDQKIKELEQRLEKIEKALNGK